MTRTQLQQIKEIYHLLEKGLTHPLKATQAYLLIQPDGSHDTPMRVKENAIQRFMMLSYSDEYNKMVEQEKIDAILPPLTEANNSNDTLDNQPKSHKEELNVDINDIQDIRNFLTKEEKEQLAEQATGTTLVVEKGNVKKRTRSPNGKRKTRK